MRVFGLRSAVLAIAAAFALTAVGPVTRPAYSQAISTNGGSIQGTVTDPSGAVLPGATITITNTDTGFKKTLTSDSKGFYSLGPLAPGHYTISMDAAGFSHLVVKTVVTAGTVSSGNAKMKIGGSGTTVEVDAGALQVNTDQIGVAGTISQQQIDTLPINGRNILDAAQLQPGVILQSGMSFDPTKAGYSAISVSGVGGRTTRILLDGQDITDETVGTTIFNVPTGAVGEAQLNRSTQDISGEVTSSGQVLEVTRSGTNKFHGNLFYNFQDNNAGFAPVNDINSPFQRNQFGGYIGGPILHDKLFFYGGAERIKQDEQDVALGANAIFAAGGEPDPTYGVPVLQQFPNTPAPFRDNFSFARLDWTAPHDIRLFARAVYSVNADDSTDGDVPYSIYQNRDNVPALVGGADFVAGGFTHSFRFGYEKFHNLLEDGTAALGNSIYNPSTGPDNQITLVGDLYAGPNTLAPQQTYQSDKQFRYDGTWTKGAHNLKFGFEMNRILGGGFAEFYGAALYTQLTVTNGAFYQTGAGYEDENCGDVAGAAPCPGDPTRGWVSPLYVIGNGNGFFSERPGFGLAGGGAFSWRFASYIGDTWKATPDLTVTAGLRWSVDTDRANQDLASPTCGEVDPSMQFTGCNSSTSSAYLFDQYEQGLGGKVHQPYADFGPQLGLVYSPGSHKTSYRAGIGIYYESDVFNNTGNARPDVITADGPYFNYTTANAGASSINLPGLGVVTAAPDGTPVSTILNESIYNAAPEVNAIKAEWQAKVKGADIANSSFIGTGNGLWADNVYAKPYVAPYSIQFNGGVQHQFGQGVLLSVDYVHNATLKVPTSIDVNHDGAARTLNTAAAQNAIQATLTEFNASSIDDAISKGATISDFAGNGLDSGAVYLYGYAASAFGLTPSTGAAFPGTNANVGQGLFILPVGKSGYDALQVVLQEQKSHPLPGLIGSNMQISYSLSRITTTAGNGQDQFFAGYQPYDNDDTTRYMGRTDLDHTNQISFGGTATVKYGPQIGIIGHFFSAPPTTMTLDTNTTPGNAGAIFVTDVDGDGTHGDLLPGTNPGDYMHSVKGSGLNNAINSYNARFAGQPTPAGQELIAAGLFTAKQLSELGGVAETLQTQPDNHPRNNPAFRSFDANVGYPIHLKWLGEGTVITPTVAMYNVFNMANSSSVGGTVLAVGDSNTNQVNSAYTWANTANEYRTTRNSGTFDQGGPRTTEFDLKIEF